MRSTVASKQDFVTMHRTLGPSEVDLKKTLGQGMDVSTSLARVEPVRPTTVRHYSGQRRVHLVHARAGGVG